jgi:putative oxidoreductase
MSGSQSPTAADFGLLAARLLLSLIFLHEGGTLLLHFSDAVALVAKTGVMPPVLAATIALQLVAGMAVAIGWRPRAGALALALFCLATALTFHTRLSVQNELLHFEKDLAIAGGMLALAIAGGGRLSMDGLRGGAPADRFAGSATGSTLGDRGRT